LAVEPQNNNNNNNNKFLGFHVISVAGLLGFCTEMQKKTKQEAVTAVRNLWVSDFDEVWK